MEKHNITYVGGSVDNLPFQKRKPHDGYGLLEGSLALRYSDGKDNHLNKYITKVVGLLSNHEPLRPVVFKISRSISSTLSLKTDYYQEHLSKSASTGDANTKSQSLFDG
jgi:hypothetical protein